MRKFCQSCMMPLAKDPERGGTNADGSKSTTYCSLCFQNGAFCWPDATGEQMRDFAYGKLREQGRSRVIAWLFTRPIPKLDRWQQVQKT